MDGSLCRTCRWWKKGLKRAEFGVCKNPDLGQYLTGPRPGFSPHESFSCSRHEPSVEWAEEAAEEIDGWYRGVYASLPEDAEERVRKFADIILRHLDTRGAHGSTVETAVS